MYKRQDLYSGALPGVSSLPFPYNVALPTNIYGWCPVGINDSGQIIAVSRQKYLSNIQYNLYDYITLSFLLNTSGDMQYLGYLPSRPQLTRATLINNVGQIIGYSATTYPYPDNFLFFLLNPGGNIQDLKSILSRYAPAGVSAIAINDKGQIAGSLDNIYYLLDPISGVRLGFINPQQSTIIDMNNAGHIVGYFYSMHYYYAIKPRAFIWRSLSPSLGELDYLFPENVNGIPTDINNLGYVIGNLLLDDNISTYNGYGNGFIWDKNNGLKKLDNLIDPADPLKPYLTVISANGINDKGQIVGIAQINDHPDDATSPCPSHQRLSCSTVVLLTPTTPSSSLTIDLLDPVPALLEGSTVSTNPESLAKKGRIVEGVGADGVATLVLRIHASSVGESITLTLDGTSTDEAGALGVLGATPNALTTTVTAESTTEGPMAFALYRAPVDFAWNESHHSLQRRSVTLSASSSSGGSATKSIDVIRPPVVLVHGLWSDSSAWSEFTPLINDKAFDLYNFDYKATNGEAIATNSDKLFKALHLIVNASSDVKNVAIAQADLVTHSMGGLITRSLPIHKDDNFSRRNFNNGYVHKLITIGTPHLGSPIARELIKPENACFNSALGIVVKPNGAIVDLVGNGDGTGISIALTRLQNLPMAMFAGQANSMVGWLTPVTAWGLKKYSCNAPIINKFTVDNYTSLMGTTKHDGIVPVTSALNNQRGIGWVWEGPLVMHSEDMAEQIEFYFGYQAHSLLESDSVISDKTVELLNKPVNSIEFSQP